MENVLLLEIKQLYDSLVAAPYGEYVHGYGILKSRMDLSINQMLKHYLIRL